MIAGSGKPTHKLPAATVKLEQAEFIACVARCAMDLYQGLPTPMSLAQALHAFTEQLLGREGVLASASRFACVKAPPRADPASDLPLPGETAAQRGRWLRMWTALDLSGMHGFPLWDGAVSRIPPRTYTLLFRPQ